MRVAHRSRGAAADHAANSQVPDGAGRGRTGGCAHSEAIPRLEPLLFLIDNLCLYFEYTGHTM